MRTTLPLLISLICFSSITARAGNDTLKVKFNNVKNQKIRDSFLKVLEKYPPLHEYNIVLVQKPIKSSTMQAQPVVKVKNLFRKVKRYQVKLAFYVRDSDDIMVSSLSEKVLMGWFAHELGHIMDYQPRNAFGMIAYGLKYLISKDFKKRAEYEADRIAVYYGFKEEIIAAKKYLLENNFVDRRYKKKIERFYMPIAEVELCQEKQQIMEPVSDTL